jgi:tetratricopeptide (TPR) repeat protein
VTSRRTISKFRLRRILKWALISAPSLIALTTIVASAVRHRDRVRVANEAYRSQWPATIKSERWDESELIGRRLLCLDKFDLPNYMSYFDSLVASKGKKEAIGFLHSAEKTKAETDLPLYRFRFAEKLMETSPTDPVIINEAITRLRQSINGGLPKPEESRARRLLASQAYASFDYDRALELLKPLESESVDVAVEIAWIRWTRNLDGDTTEARSEASKLFEELMRQVSQRKKLRLVNPTARELANIQMLLVIMGREKEFFDVVRELIVMSPAEKDRAVAEIDEYRLNAEFKKKKPDPGIVGSILISKLDANPDDIATLNQSITVWANFPSDSSDPLAKRIRERLDSDRADLASLHFAGDICRSKSKWNDARWIYSRILEKSPSDIVAMNNLAESLYKAKPYDYAKALELTELALNAEPSNAAVLETQGQILARLGKYDASRDILERCLPHFPADWNLRNTLVQIYDRIGDKTSADAHRKALTAMDRPSGTELFAELP